MTKDFLTMEKEIRIMSGLEAEKPSEIGKYRDIHFKIDKDAIEEGDINSIYRMLQELAIIYLRFEEAKSLEYQNLIAYRIDFKVYEIKLNDRVVTLPIIDYL